MATITLPTPHPGQVRVLSEAARFNVLQCGRRFGKTMLGLRVLIHTAIGRASDGRGMPVAWFAPSYKLQAEVYDEACRVLRPVTAEASRKDYQIKITGGGVLDFWSLDDPSTAGRGRKYAVAVIDEAGFVRDLEQAWTQAIRPTLTDLRGGAWFLGTPHGRNYFDRLYTRGQTGTPGWKSWRLATTDNPYMDPAEVAAAKADLPESSFAQEYLGIPADDGGNPFGIPAIRAAHDAWVKPGEPVYFGVDLAKSMDWTVVVGLDRDGNEAMFERWQSDWGATRRRVLDLLAGRGAFIDDTGVGNPVVEDMQRENRKIKGYTFTGASKQKLMGGLASAIHQRKVRPRHDVLLRELEVFEYEYSASGVRYTAPAGLHDDAVCALALAVHHMTHAAPSELPFRLIGGGGGAKRIA